MAFGLRLSRIRGGQPNSGSTSGYAMDATYATKIHKGDPVILTTDGVVEKATAAGRFDGVFLGVSYLDLKGVPTWSPYFPGANTGTEHEALVADDLDGLFEIATSSDIVTTDIGKFASLTLTAGEDSTGVSNAVLDFGSLSTDETGLNVRILRIIDKRTDGDTQQVVEVERVRADDISKTTVVGTTVPDVSTISSTAYLVAPIAGNIVKVQSVLKGAIATADAVLTTNIAGTPVTSGAITIANAGSAAGDVDSATPTALNLVAVGDLITVITDGASTNAIAAEVFVSIEPVK